MNPGKENSADPEITTKIFSVSPLKFTMLMIDRYSFFLVVIGVILLITGLITGIIWDMRIFLIVIFVICMGFPNLLLILYYKYGLSGSNYLNVVGHRLRIYKGVFTIDVLKKGELTDEELEKDSGEKFITHEFKRGSIGRYSTSKDKVIFPVVTQGKGYILLPVSAFENETEFSRAVGMMSELIISGEEN